MRSAGQVGSLARESYTTGRSNKLVWQPVPGNSAGVNFSLVEDLMESAINTRLRKIEERLNNLETLEPLETHQAHKVCLNHEWCVEFDGFGQAVARSCNACGIMETATISWGG